MAGMLLPALDGRARARRWPLRRASSPASTSAVASYVGSERVMPLPMVLARGHRRGGRRGVAAQRRRRTAEHRGRRRSTPPAGSSTFHDARPRDARRRAARAVRRGAPGVRRSRERPGSPAGAIPSAWRDAVERWSTHRAAPAAAPTPPLRLAEALLDAGGDRDEAGSLLRVRRRDRVVDRRRTAASRRPGRSADGRRLPLDGIAAPAVAASEAAAATLTGNGSSDVVRLVAAGHTNREIGDQPLHQREDRQRPRVERDGEARGAVALRGGGARRAPGPALTYRLPAPRAGARSGTRGRAAGRRRSCSRPARKNGSAT